jgi:hypothetical protein
MSYQSVATPSMSSLHVQQGLFLTLALLVTLVGGQQYQLWSLTHGTLRVQHPPTVGAVFHAPGATAAPLATVGRPSIERAGSVGEMPARQRWVF